MRALNIIGFLLMLQLSFVVVNAMNIFPGFSLGVWTGLDIVDTLTSFMPKTTDTTSYAILSLMSFVGFFVQSLIFVIMMFGYATILFPFFLGQLNLPIEVNTLLTAGVWIVYLVDYNEYRSRMKTFSGK